MSCFAHDTVAGLLYQLGRKEDFVDDAIRESLKELLVLRRTVSPPDQRQPNDGPGLPPNESPARDEVCDALAELIRGVAEIAEGANESPILDIRRERHEGADDGSLTVRGLLRFMTTRDSGGRDGAYGELVQRTWTRVGRALNQGSTAPTEVTARVTDGGHIELNEDDQVAFVRVLGEGEDWREDPRVGDLMVHLDNGPITAPQDIERFLDAVLTPTG